MSLPTILVHLDHSDRCARRVTLAASLAKVHGSHVIGLVPTGLLGGVVPEGVIPLGANDVVAKSADHLRQQAEGVARAFSVRMGEEPSTSFEVRMADGGPEAAVLRYGRASDLVVVGQDERGALTDPVTQDLARQVLLQLGRPILVVPYAGRFDEVGKRVLVAWDASREVAVALRDALPLLGGGAQVTLVSFKRVDRGDATDELRLPETTQWLRRHGIEARAEQNVTRIGIADALLSRAADLDADLIVMGGYGNSPLRERVFGGVTRDILASMTAPVLVSH